MIGSGRVRWASRLGAVAVVVAALVGCEGGAESVRFVAFGDMGTGGPGQQRVADVMSARATVQPIDFVLTLGDNFYPAGVHSVTDRYWEERFESVYGHEALGVPFYATLGNHDQQGFPQAQVDYTKHSERWTMPAPYYSFSYFLGDGTEVAFFAIETDPIRLGLSPGTDPGSFDERVENVLTSLRMYGGEVPAAMVPYIAERVHVRDDYTVGRILWLAQRTDRVVDEALVDEALAGGVRQDAQNQLRWLDTQLTQHYGARWKIVFGHHPLYGHEPRRGNNEAMIARVGPILAKHHVDLFLGGHDHLIDVMKPIDGVLHITSGAGNGDDNPYPVEPTDESFHVSTGGGITLFEVGPDELELEVVGLQGETRFRLTLTK